MKGLCELVRQQIAALFSCEEREFGTLIRTPLVRPDGDFIEVVVRKDVQGYSVTDLGETLRWLGNVGSKMPSEAWVESVLSTHAATFSSGEIFVTQSTEEGLPGVILRAAQACADLSTSVYSRRAKPERHFEADVKNRIQSHKVPTEDRDLVGASGMKWRVLQAGSVKTRFRLVSSLSSRNRSYAQNLAIKTRCMWDDLRDLKKHKETGYADYITVLDDATSGLWKPAEIKLLEKASTVVLWSEDGNLRKALGIATLGA